MGAMSQRRIVLVDDEEVLAWSLATRLGRARPSWRVETANTGEAALERIQSGPVDLLIADVRMPGMSGIDLVLTARLEQPDLPVIVMTAFQTPDLQRVTGAPYTGVLEKPFEFERLLELIDDALSTPEVGFSGAISVQTLPDIVQLYVLSSATGMLFVRHHSGEGRLWFERGSILHAVTASARGDEAFYEIMMWSGGEFGMKVGVKAPERSIATDWQSLLMESCRRIDEHRRNTRPIESESGGPMSAQGWTPSQFPPGEANDVEAFFDDLSIEEVSLVRETVKPEVPTTNPTSSPNETREVPMNVKDSLAKLNQLDGFVGAAVVDSESGMLLGSEGGGSINLEVAAAGNTEVVRAKRKTMGNLALKDAIEDILITLGKQYHLIRPLRGRPTLFFYVALDRSRANLAMARIALADVEKDLQI